MFLLNLCDEFLCMHVWMKADTEVAVLLVPVVTRRKGLDLHICRICAQVTAIVDVPMWAPRGWLGRRIDLNQIS